MKMTGMFIVLSRRRRLLLLLGIETADFAGSHRGCPGREDKFFSPYVYLLELCVKLAL